MICSIAEDMNVSNVLWHGSIEQSVLIEMLYRAEHNKFLGKSKQSSVKSQIIHKSGFRLTHPSQTRMNG